MDKPKAKAILSIQSISVFFGKKSHVKMNPGINNTKIKPKTILRTSIIEVISNIFIKYSSFII